jgi:hypothetical protein
MKIPMKRVVISGIWLSVLFSAQVNAEECKCEDLLKIKIPGYDMVINETKIIPEGKLPPSPYGGPVWNGLIPEYCRIDGEIDKRTGYEGKPYAIGFAVAMPNHWNGRFMFQGGGGLNGIVRDPVGPMSGGPPALARGFAVVSSDTGHKSGPMPFDSSFFADQEALMNFLYKAISKVTVVAKTIIEKHYSKPIKYSYYVGCSTGGREAMIVSQRYPDYFNGIVSGAPAMRTNFSNLGVRWLQVSLNQAAPKDANGDPIPGGAVSENDVDLIINAFLDACDKRDGIEDEMVFDILGCDFDPASLVCKGEKTDHCLTEQQVAALKRGMAGPVDCRGNQVYSPFLYDTGINAKTGIPGLLNITNSMLGPPTKDIKIDLDKEALAASNAYSAVGDSFNWTNLGTFYRNGGKMIFYHGVSDPWFSALDTVEYYKNLIKDNGGADKVSEWCRLFLVPGMGHCSGGEKTVDQFDMLSAIVNWVEKGEAPDTIIATGRAFPDSSRPLCPYSKYPHYTGKGDSNDAKNYECKE